MLLKQLLILTFLLSSIACTDLSSITTLDTCLSASVRYVDYSSSINTVVKANFSADCNDSDSTSYALSESSYIEVYLNGTLKANLVESESEGVYTYGYNLDASPGDSVALKIYINGEYIEEAEVQIPSELEFSSLTDSFSINATNVFTISSYPSDLEYAIVASFVEDAGGSTLFYQSHNLTSDSLTFSYSSANQALITGTLDCSASLLGLGSPYKFLRFQSGSNLQTYNEMTITGTVSP